MPKKANDCNEPKIKVVLLLQTKNKMIKKMKEINYIEHNVYKI